MTKQVRKAVLPAAGLGTRFLPATKAQPKEMLPIVDKPTIQYIVEEAVASGIEDIIVVTGRGKRAIEDHFDKAYELEEVLKSQGKESLLKQSEEALSSVNIHYIRQKEALGLGHAIYCARKFIGDEPFAVLLGDDIVTGNEPCLGQLLDVFERYHTTVVGIQAVPDWQVEKYGIIRPDREIETGLFNIGEFIEKPLFNNAPSNLAIMGRYVLRPEIFHFLEGLGPGSGGEIQLTDALQDLCKQQAVLGYCFRGKRYDVGDKLGFVKANLEFALSRSDMHDELLEFMFSICSQHYGKQTEEVK
ncbi:MAG: UTP--glucose-1-phosphate uridylyltransferase GalU [Bacillota bacterium]